MDNIDRKILSLLQHDASLSINEIAGQVNLSSTPCWKRIRRLEDEGIIKKKVVVHPVCGNRGCDAGSSGVLPTGRGRGLYDESYGSRHYIL